METTASVVVPEHRLGKKPPLFDRRTLRLATYIERRRLPKIPTVHTLSKKTLAAFKAQGGLGMMRNDVLGCCTCSALGHAFQGWTTYGKRPWRPTDDDIVAAYNKVNGGQDNGAFMLDVLNMARRDGIGGNRIKAFVALDPRNHDQVRTAHYLFGGVYFGAALPWSAQAEKVWTRTTGPGSEPWSWGGHAMNLFDTTKTTLVAATWGRLQAMTWEWWDRFVDEAYAVLEEDYIGDDKRSPQGFSLSKLEADISRL